MVNSITVKKIVEFRRMSEKRQSTFAKNLKLPKSAKPDDDGGGGDYWIRSTSGLSNAFKYNDNSFVKEKIGLVAEAYASARSPITKTMNRRNLEILHSYEDFDFSIWRPSPDLKFLSKPKIVLNIDDVPIKVIPHHVFSYENEGELMVGGIWFVVWLEGYRATDLGIYSEALFKYLSLLYSKEYKVDPNNCLIVDALGKDVVSYSHILDGKMPSLFQATIDAINKYLA